MIPLEKQCVSLELAKRLKELGVKQLDNSLWAWAQVAKKEKDALGRPLWSYEVVANNFQADIEFIAAFTVAELGEMLPKGIRTWKIDDDLWASITASATFGHSASPDNVTCWHIMALQ